MERATDGVVDHMIRQPQRVQEEEASPHSLNEVFQSKTEKDDRFTITLSAVLHVTPVNRTLFLTCLRVVSFDNGCDSFQFTFSKWYNMLLLSDRSEILPMNSSEIGKCGFGYVSNSFMVSAVDPQGRKTIVAVHLSPDQLIRILYAGDVM